MQLQNNYKLISICTVGTILEWYDFSIFGTFSPILSDLFFPNYDKVTALFAVFVVYFIGFLARPLGGIIFGYIGDKFGRKPSILISMFIMTFATVGIGLLPTYEMVGIVATIALVVLRMFQGLSASGEHTGSITYLSEVLNGRKGFLLSFIFCGVILGTLLGSLVGIFINYFFDKGEILKYAWRLPFVLSILLGLCGFYLRTKILETNVFKTMKVNSQLSKNPIISVISQHKIKLLLLTGIFSINVISFYSIFVFLPAYLIQKNIYEASAILAVTSLSMSLMAITVPCIAYLCDKFSRYIFMYIGSIGFILFTYPLLLLINEGSLLVIFFSQCILGIFNAFFLAPTPLIYTSMFDNNVRFSGVSLGMNISATIFGGLSPIIMTYVSKYSISTLLQSSYIVISAIISLISISIYVNFFLKKSLQKNENISLFDISNLENV